MDSLETTSWSQFSCVSQLSDQFDSVLKTAKKLD